MKKNRIIAGVLSVVIVTGTVFGLALSGQNDTEIEIEPTPTATVEPTEEPECTEDEECEDEYCSDDECCSSDEETPDSTVESSTSPTTESTVTPSPTSTPSDESSSTSTQTTTPSATTAPTETATPTATPKPTVSPTQTPTSSVTEFSYNPNTDGTFSYFDITDEQRALMTSTEITFYSWLHDGCSLCGSQSCGTFNYSNYSVDVTRCEYYDASTDPSLWCQICGKEAGNGTNGTCVLPWSDGTCYYCGEEIYANTCHTCK